MPDVLPSLPPLTLDDIDHVLKDPTLSVFFYVGSGGHRGARVAKAAQTLMPRLVCYLVRNHSIIVHWGASQEVRGVVFGFGQEPMIFLNKAETEDILAVVEFINEARG